MLQVCSRQNSTFLSNDCIFIFLFTGRKVEAQREGNKGTTGKLAVLSVSDCCQGAHLQKSSRKGIYIYIKSSINLNLSRGC